MQTTGEINYTFSTPLTSIGVISACNAVSEFISYSVDGGAVTYMVTNITANVNMSGTNAGVTITAQGAPAGSIYIWGMPNTPGVYTTADGFQIEGGGIGYISAQSPNTVVFNLSSVGAVGSYIDLSFNGTYEIEAVTHSITGVAHVIRDN